MSEPNAMLDTLSHISEPFSVFSALQVDESQSTTIAKGGWEIVATRQMHERARDRSGRHRETCPPIAIAVGRRGHPRRGARGREALRRAEGSRYEDAQVRRALAKSDRRQPEEEWGR